jgi:hypothetical protein
MPMLIKAVATAIPSGVKGLLNTTAFGELQLLQSDFILAR